MINSILQLFHAPSDFVVSDDLATLNGVQTELIRFSKWKSLAKFQETEYQEVGGNISAIICFIAILLSSLTESCVLCKALSKTVIKSDSLLSRK